VDLKNLDAVPYLATYLVTYLKQRPVTNVSANRARRALLVGIYEAEAVDKAWLNSVVSSDESLRHTCEYLKKSPELLPL
jgi:hypothetical protein